MYSLGNDQIRTRNFFFKFVEACKRVPRSSLPQGLLQDPLPQDVPPRGGREQWPGCEGPIELSLFSQPASYLASLLASLLSGQLVGRAT